MTHDPIHEIEQKRDSYLFWSNGTFEEYGLPAFGTDFNEDPREYFPSRYRCVGRITRAPDWQADVWERRPEMAFR
jgi:hypothetical protein